VVRSSLDEEYERELEREEEEEVQRQLPPRREPAQMKDWDYKSTVQFATFPEGVNGPKFAQILHGTGVSTGWTRIVFRAGKFLQHCNVHATQNFFKTVNATTSLDDYQRPVRDYLCFAATPGRSGFLLLLANREADGIMAALAELSRERRAPACRLLEHRIIVRCEDLPDEGPISSDMRPNSGVVALLQLLNGETQFTGTQRQQEVSQLLGFEAGADEAHRRYGIRFCRGSETERGIVALRGREPEYEKSDLQRMILRAGGY